MARDRAFWLTALAVAGVVLFAFFVRTYWNVEPASPSGTFVLSESDAYYIHHSVERIQNEAWAHPIRDPLQNYPLGGVNPNPPLWEWWIATWGALLTPLFGGDAANHPVACPASAQPSQATCVSTWWVTLASPAFFGALTVLVVVLIGREVWGWREGLFAGFFAATSTSHIERSVLGFADHDSIVLFFIVLGFLFFVKALQRAREGRWVEHFGDLGTVRTGIASYVRANQLSLAYAVMAGLAIAGVGLAWKGYAYAAGIVLVYGMLQVLVNHWRQRDSTHVFLTVGTTLLVAVLASLPYYANPALQAVFDTLLPLVFILGAWVLLGIVFTAARDLPFVLVLPAALVAGAIALAIAFVVAPSVATSLLAPLVYFKQTKLYTTIAEAHPADFNTVVFGTGVAAFFIAIFALPWMVWLNRKTWRPAWTFVAVWAVIALFMTNSAVRFMFNATPIFALLAGWGTGIIVGRLRFEAIGRNLAGLGGVSKDALKRAVNAWHVTGAVLLALLLIFPNVILAVDAGMPAQYEDRLITGELAAKGLPNTDENRQDTFIGHRFGAFGQGFIADYWRGLFEWLATQDTELPVEQRPAFLSWWDYGHWSLSLGRHPAVADNFQNGFQFAGSFIVSQNETHAIQLLLARIADQVKTGQQDESVILGALQQAGLAPDEARAALGHLQAYDYAPQLEGDRAVKALAAAEQATGQRIRYFAVDVRLFPYDNPQTQGIDFGSIFYAPVTLSDHDPDDYVEVVVRANVPGEAKQEFTQAEWDAINRDYRKAVNIDPNSVFSLYKYKEPFFNSMFYHTYLGTPVGLGGIPAIDCTGHQATFPVEGDSLPGLPLPGFCMEHFRVVYHNPQVRMLRYYPGAVLEGRVTVDGAPLEGARVVAYDDAGDMLFDSNVGLLTDNFKAGFRAREGRDLTARDFDVPHDVATTDAQGAYRLVLPFSTTGQVTVRAFVDDAEVGSRSFPVTLQQAEQAGLLDPSLGAIDARSGSLAGTVFFDADRNGAFGEGDQSLAGATVTLDGDAATQVTTDAEGTYRFDKVTPGRHAVVVAAQDHEMSQRAEQATAVVRPGAEASLNVSMALSKASATGAVWRDADGSGFRGDGEGTPGVAVKLLADFRAPNTALADTAFTRENGTLAFDVTPGAYVARGEYIDPADGQAYAFGLLLDVPKGADALALDEADTRLQRATPVSLNLTIEREPGNFTAATSAHVLAIPAQAGLPAGERAAANGTLAFHLVPGTYQVHAETLVEGVRYRLAPMTLVVGTEPVAAEGRLARQG